jgi:CheY-like chemotaxis protein
MSWAIHLSKVLVATGSPVLASLLKQQLSPRASTVMTSVGVWAGLQEIAKHADLSLVLCDVDLPDGDGFRLLEFVRSLEEPKPKVLLFAAAYIEAQARRAAALGAIGLLTKPISFDDIAAVLLAPSASGKPRPPRRRPMARAVVLESGLEGSSQAETPQLFWPVRDLSRSGAFLETAAPLPIGLRMEISLELESLRVSVTAEVVRNQDPSWDHAAGVGIRFLDFPDRADGLIATYAEQATGSSHPPAPEKGSEASYEAIDVEAPSRS